MYCPICGKNYNTTAHVCTGFIYPPQGAIAKPPYHPQDAEIEQLRAALAVKEKECGSLRELLFWHHHAAGHDIHGDDGAWECSSCIIDFRNDSIEKIKGQIQRYIERKDRNELS